MSLRYAVLASLLEGEASGCELSEVFDVSFVGFGPATPQQLYREVERLGRDGLVGARFVQQDRRPNKRMFLTGAGRDDLRPSPLSRPAGLPPSRDGLLIRLQALEDPETTPALFEERVTWARGRLDRHERVRSRMLDGRTEACGEENLRRCERVLTVLQQRAGKEW